MSQQGPDRGIGRRIAEHVRGHWVAYAVGFVALSGTAIAADGPLPGKNQVGSLDIINGEVISADLRDGQVKGVDIAAETVTGADVDEASLGIVPRAKRANNAARVDGKDFSDIRATELLNNLGPLPKTTSYLSEGGTLLISLSGSGYRSTLHPGLIGMRLKIDGQQEHFIDVYTNELDSHKAFVSGQAVVDNLAAGLHEVRLEALYDEGICNTGSESNNSYCTTTNSDDVFQVSVLEIPDG